jgi:hypothetical protein
VSKQLWGADISPAVFGDAPYMLHSGLVPTKNRLEFLLDLRGNCIFDRMNRIKQDKINILSILLILSKKVPAEPVIFTANSYSSLRKYLYSSTMSQHINIK